jgi:hypothetical protein
MPSKARPRAASRPSRAVQDIRGASLRPVPPGESTIKDTRYLDIHQDDALDEAQLAAWIQQAAALPGWGA